MPLFSPCHKNKQKRNKKNKSKKDKKNKKNKNKKNKNKMNKKNPYKNVPEGSKQQVWNFAYGFNLMKDNL